MNDPGCNKGCRAPAVFSSDSNKGVQGHSEDKSDLAESEDSGGADSKDKTYSDGGL
jgi:hypothetical protein